MNAVGAGTWFNWTQYPDHGPGLEVLNLERGSRVLDLGCGKGGNLAHVHSTGHHGVGVDVSALQVAQARTRWPDLRVVLGDAVAFLEDGDGEEPFDAAYSVFGALWFVDPDVLLPAIHRRLRGTLAFSWSPMNGVSALARWDLEPDEWGDRLDTHGFGAIEHLVIDPPPGVERGQPTFLMRARRAS
ncbi:class I SAM-dependent methyltransferase [Catellatospora tritici]|uniref:class I SAM-dependent methyltransferase n=1 Tax=Catellatospora tritici TaxID=2851566 RepID=UPI001C2D572D|nr:class I SAM-dependent methyltransferase [Catellatospora tritici]MBV1851484.1 class I SAM-dependent methyltransferase [Catellatospora tritici]